MIITTIMMSNHRYRHLSFGKPKIEETLRPMSFVPIARCPYLHSSLTLDTFDSI